MTEAAVRLLATKSVEGAAFADVLAATDAPRGSVYHHFPSGKTELLHAALDLASERGLEIIEATRGQSAAVVTGRFLDLWRELLDRSHFSAGCAVVAVTVAANDAKLLDHAGTIFRAWTERLSAKSDGFLPVFQAYPPSYPPIVNRYSLGGLRAASSWLACRPDR